MNLIVTKIPLFKSNLIINQLEVDWMSLRDDALQMHKENQGKLEIKPDDAKEVVLK